MSEQKLSRCGGTCKEDSAVVKLYNPIKLYPTKADRPVTFSRVAYCLNHGCGWRQKYPDIHVGIEEAVNGKSQGIDSYLRQAQKKFSEVHVDAVWRIWIYLDVENFECYLKEMEKMNLNSKRRGN